MQCAMVSCLSSRVGTGDAATASAGCGINFLNLTTFVTFRVYAHDPTTTSLPALAYDHGTPLNIELAWTQQ